MRNNYVQVEGKRMVKMLPRNYHTVCWPHVVNMAKTYAAQGWLDQSLECAQKPSKWKTSE